MLRNLGIRWQILSALALPLLVLTVLCGQAAWRSAGDMRETGSALDLARANGGFLQLVRSLELERAQSEAVLTGAGRDRLEAARRDTDARLAVVRDSAFGRPEQAPDAGVRDAIAPSVRAHQQLGAARREVDGNRPGPAIAMYSSIVDSQLDTLDGIGRAVPDEGEAASFQRLAALGRAAEALSREQLVGSRVLRGRVVPTSEQQRMLGALQADQEQNLDLFRRIAPPAESGALERALGRPEARLADVARLRATIAAAGTSRPPAVLFDEYVDATGDQLGALTPVLQLVAADGVEAGEQAYGDARGATVLTLAVAIVIVLVTLLLALFTSRRISAPVRDLTEAATRLSDGLPALVARLEAAEPAAAPLVRIAGRGEVARLAEALDEINAVTLRIAREQVELRAATAAMFVNVARRHQALLSRQLTAIEQLERDEVDPEALDGLFRLDHLAARMRRNAESLLVLAGVESSRRLRAPIPLSDVLRIAAAEIEHDTRVTTAVDADPPLHPHVALPATHLVAELLENATNFSDPGSPVLVTGFGHAEGVRLTIADAGLGMSPAELAAANDRIANPPAADGIGSQRLGFLVVGRLAQRLDTRVCLRAGAGRGTVAFVDLPAALFGAGSLAGLPVIDADVFDLPPAPVPLAGSDPTPLRLRVPALTAGREPDPTDSEPTEGEPAAWPPLVDGPGVRSIPDVPAAHAEDEPWKLPAHTEPHEADPYHWTDPDVAEVEWAAEVREPVVERLHQHEYGPAPEGPLPEASDVELSVAEEWEHTPDGDVRLEHPVPTLASPAPPHPWSPPGRDAHPEPWSAPESASVPEPGSAPEWDADPEPWSAPESASVPEPGSAPEWDADPEPWTVPVPAAEPEPWSAPEWSTDPEPWSVPELAAEQQSWSGPAPAAEPESWPAPEVAADPQPWSGPAWSADPKPWLVPEPAAEPEPWSPAPALEPEPWSVPAWSADPDPDPEPWSAPEVAADPEPWSEPEPEEPPAPPVNGGQRWASRPVDVLPVRRSMLTPLGIGRRGPRRATEHWQPIAEADPAPPDASGTGEAPIPQPRAAEQPVAEPVHAHHPEVAAQADPGRHEPEQPEQPGQRRARTAADVRTMLAGYKAGVERGRTPPSRGRVPGPRDPEDRRA